MIALTIGMFDGVHLGHQHLIQKMRDLVGASGKIVVYTFSNHPRNEPLIMSKEVKEFVLSSFSVNHVKVLSFDPIFLQTPYDTFIDQIREEFPFDHLVMGQGARFGYKRLGGEEEVLILAKKLKFEATYLEKLPSISSSIIRSYLKSGNISEAEKLLGHPVIFKGRDFPSLLPSGKYLVSELGGEENKPIIYNSETIDPHTLYRISSHG